MSVVRAIATNAAAGVAVAERPEYLKAFLKPGCAAAIWRRRPDERFQSWLNTLDPAQLPQGRLVVRPDAVRGAMAGLCDAAQTPVGPQRDHLIADAAALATIFSDLLRPRYLRLRLQAITSNACRKFHIDALTARMICTYRGTGTQYGISTDGNEPKRVFTVPTGAPILLRGTLWPEAPASGLLHRSPPIQGTGETRLVLVIDPIMDAEDIE